ncbi:MAG: hypothetical protein JNL60_14885, partial [Bacteroidia bacterium]|nr:hypothetical protein [Bacteroidia bacterium]
MKHILFCFFTTLALSGIGQINLDSGLVACYPLNAGAADLKNGHNGVLYSVGHAQDRFGKSKRAVYFDGTPGCYAELPNHFDLKGNSVAFSAWVNAVGVSNNGNYIIFTKNNNPNGPANIEAY